MSDETTTGGGETLPPGDPDTLDLGRPPLWEQWSEEAQKDASAFTAQSREQVLEGLVTRLEEREALLTGEAAHTTSGAATVLTPTEPDPAAAGVLANGETVTADDLDGMPWYEARVEVYVRNGPPGDEYGVGGDKIAHTRAVTQAPSFAAASQRLDADLGPKWQHLLQVAPLADQAPSPDPEPEVAPPLEWGSVNEGWNAWTYATLVLVIIGLVAVVASLVSLAGAVIQ